MQVAQRIAPHVASVNASIEQRGEQRFQPHVERFVERHASWCESTITDQSARTTFGFQLVDPVYRCVSV